MINFKFFLLITLINSIKTDSSEMSKINVELKSAFDQELYQKVLDPEKCKKQLDFLKNNPSIGMQFIDASGKIPTGILLGNLADLGSYHQCLSIGYLSDDIDIGGKYCMIQVPLQQKPVAEDVESANSYIYNIVDLWPRLDNNTLEVVERFIQIKKQAQMISGPRRPVSRGMPFNLISTLTVSLGTCIPKACQTKQVIDYFLGHKFLNSNITYKEFFCRLPNDKPFSTADYIAFSIFSLIILITILSTSYELWHLFVLRTDNSNIVPLYRCFSLHTNTKRFLTFNTVPGALDCVDGIRAISMLWVIIGHIYSLSMLNFVYNIKDVSDWLTLFTSTWINAAPITVDTFFMLSGVLCVYTVIGKVNRCKFIKLLHFFYLHRLLRIFPLLAIVILLQASIFHRVSDGPMWVNMGQMTAMCRKRWWSALLHVQNYVKPIGICLYQTWYLSVDIQLHIVSPLVLLWLFGSPIFAWCALALAIIASLALSSTYSFLDNYSAALANPSRMNQFGDYFINYYINTLTRASPFFIGMMYGYLLHRCRGKNIYMGKIFIVISWILTFALLAFCIFSNYPIMQVDHEMQMFDNFLNAYMRGIWAVALGWLIFACVHGYGGPINWFLCLSLWKLPARLSYAMYLLHYSIIMIANGSLTSTYYFSDANILYRAMGDLAFTTIAAIILSITIDAPFSTLQKMLLGGGKKKPKETEKESRNEIEESKIES